MIMRGVIACTCIGLERKGMGMSASTDCGGGVEGIGVF